MDTLTKDVPLTLADRKKAALAAYVETGIVASACRAVGIGRTTWYRWIREDKDFAAVVENAREMVADDLESEAVRRAKNGSDVLLIFLLKGLKPEKYGNRVAGNITVRNPTLEKVFE